MPSISPCVPASWYRFAAPTAPARPRLMRVLAVLSRYGFDGEVRRTASAAFFSVITAGCQGAAHTSREPALAPCGRALWRRPDDRRSAGRRWVSTATKTLPQLHAVGRAAAASQSRTVISQPAAAVVAGRTFHRHRCDRAGIPSGGPPGAALSRCRRGAVVITSHQPLDAVRSGSHPRPLGRRLPDCPGGGGLLPRHVAPAAGALSLRRPVRTRSTRCCSLRHGNCAVPPGPGALARDPGRVRPGNAVDCGPAGQPARGRTPCSAATFEDGSPSISCCCPRSRCTFRCCPISLTPTGSSPVCCSPWCRRCLDSCWACRWAPWERWRRQPAAGFRGHQPAWRHRRGADGWAEAAAAC